MSLFNSSNLVSNVCTALVGEIALRGGSLPGVLDGGHGGKRRRGEGIRREQKGAAEDRQADSKRPSHGHPFLSNLATTIGPSLGASALSRLLPQASEVKGFLYIKTLLFHQDTSHIVSNRHPSADERIGKEGA